MAFNSNMKFSQIKQSDGMNLDKQVSLLEVRRAIFEMGVTKALGSDGFLALFYQANWNKVKKSLFDLVKVVFEGKVNIKQVNQTLITLIPK